MVFDISQSQTMVITILRTRYDAVDFFFASGTILYYKEGSTQNQYKTEDIGKKNTLNLNRDL